MTTFFAILLGTLAAGIGSVWLAAALSHSLARYTQHMLSLAAGALLGAAFLHLLPEAFESAAHLARLVAVQDAHVHSIDAHTLFIILLGGVLFFFLLDKAELWHHGHEHHHGHAHHHDAHDEEGHGGGHSHHADHDAGHGHGRTGVAPMSGGWTVLAGDSVHCFGDGILIASAFMADLRLGVIAAVAVLAHEVPHHMGDLVVLRAASGTRRAALLKVTLAGAITALGGVLGWWLLDWLHDYLPYFLVIASSSFIYVALADLIPQLQKRLSLTATLAQISWLLAGIGLVMLTGTMAHAH
ncbi:dihydroorotate dehydrogenase [Hylemonella gracilis str. Niagara R]|uniref:Dihydroorotate dehydrogenase n=1 Tax=Hylemonella gracilis str. Niagara R TaxID=1458275 RepID=A0A016XGE1_9BURK|nr:ZIP family metal transporter [Hylemonella gracilis]EYC50612.1 dihydroorotate dehydrogenase [Hylemonella gracilis str. Niagara R]